MAELSSQLTPWKDNFDNNPDHSIDWNSNELAAHIGGFIFIRSIYNKRLMQEQNWQQLSTFP